MSSLIEKEGKHYIKGKVVMLATNYRENTLWLNPNGQLIHTHLSGKIKALIEIENTKA